MIDGVRGLFRMLAISCFLIVPAAFAQHGVIREYAALAPTPDATPLRPLMDIPLTDTSITRGHDGAYYLTGSEISGNGAVFSPAVTIWRSGDMQRWSRLRRRRFRCASRRER